ncbi:MAG TPA: serine/threonine-protein kinase [Kofleriaceae bacterium]|nr:serine/threonine-protein kinase [Kofleriaceae bacterium]
MALRDHVIQVGQVLDKYELLERVGQGGMAIVYRGVDRQLKRVVAIKVLHKHLADYQEARDRFEREAQAVAKLRHENILEIFDYSGADEAEAADGSYIVTEFIDGQTLKQRVTERPITFPELGAMIVLQVCRALAHAHAAGILHRDVKPENIMIRTDGVVKLMDFGISHMVDLERLTVTGQLLGSPAYMAPEHVEGRPLDFRTDVFAAGIVLYQLTVGKLPFEGKNPHEVLKRIAECRFVDPRQANPRIGNRLGRVILRAMAAQPADRFQAIGEMVVALEGYLDESGIAPDKVTSELGRYFDAPAAYEQALRDRMIDHLTRRGQQQMAKDGTASAAALDVFDRVLTLDPHNAKVLDILGGLNRRRRLRTHATALALIAALGGCAWLIHRNSQPPPAEPPPVAIDHPGALLAGADTRVARLELPALPAADPPAAGAPSTPSTAPTPVSTAQATPAARPTPPADAPAALPAVAAAQPTKIRVSPAKDAEYAVGAGARKPVPDDGIIHVELTGDAEVHVYSLSKCCQEGSEVVHPGGDVTIVMPYLPGRIVAACAKRPAAEVRIAGRAANLGVPFSVPIGDSTDETKQVEVEFLGDHLDPTPIKVMVEAGKTRDVQCVVAP